MNPKYWGRSFWLTIFIIITKFKHDVETCKKHLYVICRNLPCAECSNHALLAIDANNVMSSKDINYIYFFFIRLHNNLVTDPTRLIRVDRVRKLI